MQNAKISVGGKEIITSCVFHAQLNQEVLIKFFIEEDEFSIKLKMLEGEKNEIAREADLSKGFFEWEMTIYIQKNSLGFVFKEPIVFAQSKTRKLYYSMNINRVTTNDSIFNTMLVVYKEEL